MSAKAFEPCIAFIGLTISLSTGVVVLRLPWILEECRGGEMLFYCMFVYRSNSAEKGILSSIERTPATVLTGQPDTNPTVFLVADM